MEVRNIWALEESGDNGLCIPVFNMCLFSQEPAPIVSDDCQWVRQQMAREPRTFFVTGALVGVHKNRPGKR